MINVRQRKDKDKVKLIECWVKDYRNDLQLNKLIPFNTKSHPCRPVSPNLLEVGEHLLIKLKRNCQILFLLAPVLLFFVKVCQNSSFPPPAHSTVRAMLPASSGLTLRAYYRQDIRRASCLP